MLQNRRYTATNFRIVKASAIRALRSVLGLPCWQVRWDNQVGLDMNFGPPRLDVHEPRQTAARSTRVRENFARRRVFLKGTHWLVADPDSWTLRLADGLVVRRTSSAKRQNMAVARLRGEKVRAIVIERRTGATLFQFDLGATLEVRPPRRLGDDEYELWTLIANSRSVVVCAGGFYRTGSTKRNDAALQPIDSFARNSDPLVIGSPPHPPGAASARG
jgi:hypothetical protein